MHSWNNFKNHLDGLFKSIEIICLKCTQKLLKVLVKGWIYRVFNTWFKTDFVTGNQLC